jgi:hypothetical protein
VFLVRFAAALEKASLTACPATRKEATAIKEINTKSVFGKVLTFLFLPKPHEMNLHSVLPV